MSHLFSSRNTAKVILFSYPIFQLWNTDSLEAFLTVLLCPPNSQSFKSNHPIVVVIYPDFPFYYGTGLRFQCRSWRYFLYRSFIFMEIIRLGKCKNGVVLNNVNRTTGVRMCQAMRWGAENRQMQLDSTVNKVKTIKHTLSTTIAAYFHSAITSLTRSSRRMRPVMYRSSRKMALSSRCTAKHPRTVAGISSTPR